MEMRKEEIWRKRILPKLIKRFTPRIQQDLLKIEWPANLPNEISNLYLYGETEVGKTIYAAFLCLHASKLKYLTEDISGKDFLFVSFPELFMEIKETFEDKTKSEVTVLNKYREVDLLVLDDFGVKNSSDWFIEVLYVIINYRYEQQKTTVFTSNYSLQEMASLLGDDRISSRIERMCRIMLKKTWK